MKADGFSKSYILIFLFRQSYDVEMEISLDGTGVRSSNILDLKNPFFRYTGVQTSPPPGNNTSSPTETYWNSASVVLNGGIMNTSTAYAGQPSHGSGNMTEDFLFILSIIFNTLFS